MTSPAKESVCMTKPHFNTISSSSSHEIQESMSKGLNCIPEPDRNRSSLQTPLRGAGLLGMELGWLVLPWGPPGPQVSRQPPSCGPSWWFHSHHTPRRNLITTFTRICYKELSAFYHNPETKWPQIPGRWFHSSGSWYNPGYSQGFLTSLQGNQFIVAFPGKSTSLSLTIHQYQNLSQSLQEFLGWRVLTDHVDWAQSEYPEVTETTNTGC